MCANISVDFSQFLIKIWDAALVQLMCLGRPKPRVEQLEQARAELRAKMADINRSISLAKGEGQIPTDEIQLWKSSVQELEEKVGATKQDFERWRCLGSWSWNCFSVNRRVAERMTVIDKLMTRADATPVTTNPPPSQVVEIPTSNLTFGMEAYERKIVGYIKSAEVVEVIGVYGMGGVGKTTLLSSINNHKDVATRFDHVIWAVASRECKMERLQTAIAKRLKLKLEEDDSEEDHAAKLFDFLKNKDCLLLLDDLWAPLDLAKLGMAYASLKQREQKRKVVVFTTRHKQICGDMKASRAMEIKCLENKQAWELFRRNAGENAIGSDAGIDNIAHQIVKECAGLPLALVTVGMAMSTKSSWEAWDNALRMMKDSEMPKVTGKNEEDLMFSVFKLSFDSLEDDNMRGRLLSCAMWPEDHSINRDALIECWIGLGLIDKVGTIHKVYNQGHSHIDTLKAACLLEPGDDEEEEVKMHDVIRDMVLCVASDCGKKKCKWIVSSGDAVSQALEDEGWHEAERVSLMYSDIASIPNQLSICSKLSLLMLQHNYKVNEIDGTLVEAMVALTYLDLEHTHIREIPKEIGMLSQLQHLNLNSTPIRALPAELGSLTKLNYLLQRKTLELIKVAKGAISNLSSLRWLDLRGNGYITYWDELKMLKGCQKSMDINLMTGAGLQHLCSLLPLTKWQLCMDGGSPDLNQLMDDVMRSSNITHNMEQMTIHEVRIDKLLIRKENKEAKGFECLKLLTISGGLLREIKWKEVQPYIVFPNIRKLIICGCKELRNVNWAMQLPSLCFLSLSCCTVMKELISDESSSSSSSFGLKRMWLCEMRNLERISHKPLSFPYLEKIEVESCPLLRELSFTDQISANKLKEIRCEQIWWDNLKWKKVSTKKSLLHLVKKVNEQ